MIKKVIIFVIGATVILIGVLMIVLPGPAIIVIPAGLAILATEFLWARRLLQNMKDKAAQVGMKLAGKTRKSPQDPDIAPKS